jgi:hypothetical protein
MTSKITAAAVAAVLLASAGVASAQTNNHWARASVHTQGPSSDSYYNRHYWDAVAPYGRAEQRDPYIGTIWEGVVPY